MIQFIWANHNLQTSVLGILDLSGKWKDNYSLELKTNSSFVAGTQIRNNIRKKTNHGVSKLHWHEQWPLFPLKDGNLPNWSFLMYCGFFMLNLKYIRMVILAIVILLKIQQNFIFLVIFLNICFQIPEYMKTCLLGISIVECILTFQQVKQQIKLSQQLITIF